MARYYHTFPHHRKPKQRFSALFNNEEDKAKLAYNKDMAFRQFVQTFDIDNPELLGWSMVDFYRKYKSTGYQLTIAF
jgi:hypothetical protein